jgi:hypothetical protein
MRSIRYRILRTVSYTWCTAKKGIERVVVAREGTLVLRPTAGTRHNNLIVLGCKHRDFGKYYSADAGCGMPYVIWTANSFHLLDKIMVATIEGRWACPLSGLLLS